MRPLNIASSPDKTFVLETALPECALFVQTIARQHAETQQEFNDMCLTGLKAAQDFKATADLRHYDSFVVRTVQHYILELKHGRTSF